MMAAEKTDRKEAKVPRLLAATSILLVLWCLLISGNYSGDIVTDAHCHLSDDFSNLKGY